MNFLDLCKRVALDAGVTITGPSSVQGQQGILLRLVNWTSQAVIDIQSENTDWKFLWRTVDSNLNQGQSTYIQGDFGFSGLANLKLVFVNNKECEIRDWNWWVENIRRIENKSEGLPSQVTVAPDGKLHFYPIPNDAFSLTIDYYHEPIPVVDNVDVPVIPANYHMTIVHRALMYYAEFEDDAYRYQQSLLNYERGLDILTRDQVPDIKLDVSRMAPSL